MNPFVAFQIWSAVMWRVWFSPLHPREEKQPPKERQGGAR